MNLDVEIALAAERLRLGGVVAMPTETVYGLAADAANPQAVARVFHIKQRPTYHPLILHLASGDWLDDFAGHVPEAARALARRYWPGPLTLVLSRSPAVLPSVTGGQDSVALRVPDHPMARELIAALGRPVVAPSANRFTRVSPTCAEDVRDELGASVDLVLDGGPCRMGLESTIVDIRSATPRLLRPGAIAVESLVEVLGAPLAVGDGSTRAPGQHALHYSPQARVVLVDADELVSRAHTLARSGARVGVLVPQGIASTAFEDLAGIHPIPLPASPERYASELYRYLRQLDRLSCKVILASLPPDGGLGTALRDRLLRAAGSGPVAAKGDS